MLKLKVTGMSCAACSARVQKAVNSVKNAENVSVNLLTGDLLVEGDVVKDDVINAVKKAGYGIENDSSNPQSSAEKDAYKPIKRRLILSVILLLVLMYFSMFRMLFSVPVPKFFADNPSYLGVFELFITLIVCIINRRFFINGIKGIINGAPNMDTLVSLGAASSYFYSLYIVIKEILGNPPSETHLYFESAAMILTLITVGKLLEAKAKGKTLDIINSLKALMPETATVIKDGKEQTVPLSLLKKGDIFTVRSGEAIPADGVVLEGSAAVDESSVTGESIPVHKKEGDSVTGVTVNQNGYIKCRAEALGEDSVFGRIIDTVNSASATKAPIARIADKVAGVFVPIVIALSLLTLIIWLLIGKSGGFALTRAISVLVISCPCALGLATPVAITVASGVGAKHGVLYKSAEALETCGKISTVILDKTGTVTKGTPEVTSTVFSDETKLLRVACSLESNSSHPLGSAVIKYAEKTGVSPAPVTCFKEIAGVGIEGVVDGVPCFGGSAEAAAKRAPLGEYLDFVETVKKDGKTPLVFIMGDDVLGVIAAADTVKEDAFDTVKAIKKLGADVVMLTGDNEVTAKAIAKSVGINTVIAGVLPDQKAETVKLYRKSGRVAMVGDGINDAPALKTADMGIAVGGGKDICSAAADAVLMNDGLSGVLTALSLGKKTLINIKENLFWAFFYNILAIPLAAGALESVFGFSLNPMLGAAAMSLSSFCVCMNALRLNFFKIKNNKITDKTEEKTMTKTIKITGMMCPHCENHTKTALLAVDGVTEATASHEKGEAVVTLSKAVDDAALKKAVTDAGYTVTEII